MIIFDGYIFSAVVPFETNAPLLVNSYAVLSFAFSLQNFELIAWWIPKILKNFGGVNANKLIKRPLLYASRNFSCRLPLP